MTDAKRKDEAAKEHPNLGQDEAEMERASQEKLEHMEGDKPRRGAEKSPQRSPAKAQL